MHVIHLINPHASHAMYILLLILKTWLVLQKCKGWRFTGAQIWSWYWIGRKGRRGLCVLCI